MRRHILTGWALSVPAFFVVIALQSFYPLTVAELPRWYSVACMYLFFYLLYMARLLVLLTRNKELMKP